MNEYLMSQPQRSAPECDCAEMARSMDCEDPEWFCWMFGCGVCTDTKVNCGRP